MIDGIRKIKHLVATTVMAILCSEHICVAKPRE